MPRCCPGRKPDTAHAEHPKTTTKVTSKHKRLKSTFVTLRFSLQLPNASLAQKLPWQLHGHREWCACAPAKELIACSREPAYKAGFSTCLSRQLEQHQWPVAGAKAATAIRTHHGDHLKRHYYHRHLCS